MQYNIYVGVADIYSFGFFHAKSLYVMKYNIRMCY